MTPKRVLVCGGNVAAMAGDDLRWRKWDEEREASARRAYREVEVPPKLLVPQNRHWRRKRAKLSRQIFQGAP